MPVRSEFTPQRHGSRRGSHILTRGWGTGLARGGLAFLRDGRLGQALAFAVNIARSPASRSETAAKLGWLYFGCSPRGRRWLA